MLVRACWTLSELALFAGLLALVVGGCSGPASVPDLAEADPGPDAATTEQLQKVNELLDAKEAEVNAAADIEDVPLIPRDVLFGNPTRAQARLSPDGAFLSFLAPVDGVLNVWVAPSSDPAAANPVTQDKSRGIRSHSWAYNSTHIVYTQDKQGDENWHVYASDVRSGQTTDLTPVDGVNARLMGASDKFPDELLIGLNDREPHLHDVYQVNVLTGQRRLVQQNPGFAGFDTDEDLKVRLAVTFTPTAGQRWLEPQGEAGPNGYEDWKPIEEFEVEDASTSGPVGYDGAGRRLYFTDSRGRDTAGLFERNLDTGEDRLLADDPRADVAGLLVDPIEKRVQAASFTYSRREWKILDESIRLDVEFLTEFADGEWQVTSRTLDDAQWTVAYIFDDGPVKYYRYDRPTAPPFSGVDGERKMTYLFSSRDDLAEYPLVKMHTPVIASRDGLNLVSYLTLPPGADPDGDGVPNAPTPLVLDVHGGPWARDGWGYNASHQWLANRGYAVLSVNYRGSTGFGKNFQNASNGEWAKKMHDDLIDAVDWAVEQKITTKDQVAIMGGSYGGYATLVGLTFTPEVFACGVDIVGPSSLVTLLENAPAYWRPVMPLMKARIGDWTTEEGRAELLKISPLTYVDKIVRPLLIGQGANDPRVTQVEADQIVRAMADRGIPVTYALYPDEGHGFARPENRTSFNAVTEAFLAEHLGGRFEPIGDDLRGASLHVPVGADGVPGLADALPAARQAMPPAEDTAEDKEKPAAGE